MDEFYIWDEDAQRAMRIKQMLIKAMADHGVKTEIVIHSEPPLLARNQMTGNTPAIQYQGNVWSCKDKNITEQRIKQLLAKIYLV